MALLKKNSYLEGEQSSLTSNLPKWVRGWFKQEGNRTGSTSGYKFRVPGQGSNNRSGSLQGGHQHGSGLRISGDTGGPLKWETVRDNQIINKTLEMGQQNHTVLNLPRWF